jgi:hypothetical protein
MQLVDPQSYTWTGRTPRQLLALARANGWHTARVFGRMWIARDDIVSWYKETHKTEITAALAAIQAFASVKDEALAKEEPETAVTDLLVSLIHLCRANAIDLRLRLDAAERHVAAEISAPLNKEAMP